MRSTNATHLLHPLGDKLAFKGGGMLASNATDDGVPGEQHDDGVQDNTAMGREQRVRRPNTRVRGPEWL
jgi:hypothetical protein